MARRSFLFAPGDSPDMMRKAVETGADVVVFDLEDAVAPHNKDDARKAISSVLEEVSTDSRLCVRLNPVDAGAGDDIETVMAGQRPDSVLLPKVNSIEDVNALVRLLDDHRADVPILALIESAAGVLRADTIASNPRIEALLFGAEDLAADIGATRTDEGTEVLYARQRVVIAAAAGNIDAIDTVYTDFDDREGLREETAFAIQLGYEGKMAIHPDQVPVINDAFTPSTEEIEWAERVTETADETDAAVFSVAGEMIDAPLITQARRILDRAREAGRR